MPKTCPMLGTECIKGNCIMWIRPRLAEDGVTVLEPGYCTLAKM